MLFKSDNQKIKKIGFPYKNPFEVQQRYKFVPNNTKQYKTNVYL